MGLFASTVAHLGGPSRDEVVTAVDNVTLSIPGGSAYGLVGESGCGKSTLGRLAAGLLAPSSGSVSFEGARIDAGGTTLSARQLLRVQMVFQNPMASLNPRQRVVDIVSEAAVYHGLIDRKDRVEFAAGLLDEVGLPREALFRLPHQFSGGQRQRIGIARALSVSPDFLICDEPIAALDVSIQAQILNLLFDLRKKRGLTMLFISHDLGVVHYLCDTVGVMYLGRIVETAPTAELFRRPQHPYTQALLAQIPSRSTGRRDYQPIVGEMPSPLAPPKGCHFNPRCPSVMAICREEAPPETTTGTHRSRCWLSSEKERDLQSGEGRYQ
ncbi:MAG: ABC transporter ATP-binding protein [Devosia sp.]|uniref:ABC transporter ATP-binding protein n=1 Tax=Devosia sp. TaxID=1871048 RepID=UPI001A5371CE|nr:ABC transporter ATP-binding protein [Devosia sp.]MBL8600000.1 ABC transporter ATP-binding protein [Devosia sp.]